MAIIFDGRAYASQKESLLKLRVEKLKEKGKIPRLASILIGDNPASKLYVDLKKKAAEEIGVALDVYSLRHDVKADDVLKLIDSLNKNQAVNGIMIQLPLPGSLSKDKGRIISTIDSRKDVDGLRVDSPFLHPTSKAVVEILDRAKLMLGKKPRTVCVIGATGMVGRPLVKELKKKGYRVTEGSSETKNLADKTRKADVLISAIGKANLLKGDMVKDGAVIIDVGSPKGDVQLSEVAPKVSFVTPVPGGVGPVTIACLLENLVEACQEKKVNI
ncbi:MAG: Bifunctional protein FolD [Candidatus Woesebacteria bacterium GW2011_GWC2_47_16]|uniref:Bifunctional protein FolD n=9 Tax=Candidatus Woeseibacteriota TaxID=1752722 RepID=A0A0G1SYI7_9BACT|nr:MAG: Bifunctional protein FolD [Candidatus Woesebacteria bacterium GW2011_GWE1_45_18]KKU25253.1 MAG: Bifunctional protein FolD [Candidatus Woesebacteria bacterium GW2011_GWF1_46_13]KKU47028.1 MAG: Bifunctional protein FolD [Candidatus Woesebacteria bacterium GW2011_GWF2_46_8]KKU65236.1 MAG: Bifunctional protein FolD [Candidatus Woesebacteria bacterium GW2011_GWC2_47_16]KKU71060.1 MAG: Bifunctional protein FolD [Candidatus Woesebacteria bacterium GW2011_GWD1_47_21]OGM77997.1 MAG: hypothetica